MTLIKVAAGVVNQTPLDWDRNKQNILHAIEKAQKEQVSILCLPEMCITGYGCEDAFFSPNTHAKAIEVLHEILPATQNMVVSLGLPVVVQNKIFNAACLIVDRQIVGFVAKKFLAGEGIHYEPRWFLPWKAGEVAQVELQGKQYPIGDLYFKVGGVKIGFEICEDAWVANRPGRDLFNYGIDIILNPSASHFAFQKLAIRERFVLEGSRAFGVSYIYANLLGNEAGRAIYDGGALIASRGELLAAGERLSFKDFDISTALIDLNLTRMTQAQSRVPFEKADKGEFCIEASFEYPEVKPEIKPFSIATWEKSPFLKEEEFSRAVALSLYDYMRKSRSRGFVISLSGGADSAAVSCLCYLMIELGVKSIGMEAFIHKLGYIKDIENHQTVEQLATRLITCVYQATKNSGNVTRNAAEQLATALHANYDYLYIDEIVENYKNIVSESIGRQLNWEQDDITLQNIQARVRAPSVWMLANIRYALLLSTSNRSEAAVGYATMDGDTSGGLSPIAGIDKAFLRKWLKWLETEGIEGAFTIPALSYINEQQPTAELRPQEESQTDEGDLMPYDLLDSIEEAAIRDKCSPLQSFLRLKAQYPQYTEEQLKQWTDKFFKLWCRNQWKRERYAPSFHLDDENLDPKTWCRFPILSGGFERELKILWEYS